jgi:hypothetical protein
MMLFDPTKAERSPSRCESLAWHPSRRFRAGLLALPLAAAGIVTAGPDAQAFPGDCRFGVNAHQASNNALDLAAGAGIGWVRFDMNWHQFEPQQGQYNWTEADRFIDHAQLLGLNVFVTIAYSPSWAVAQPCNDNDANPANTCRNRLPLNVASWTGFVTAAVNRYQGKVTHWGMWNEPNLEHFFSGTREQYVNQLLIPGSDAVHAACPTCLVLGPELAHLRGANWDADEGVCIGTNCAFNGWNYSLARVLEAAGSYCDIISHHKYAAPASVFWPEAVDGEWIANVQIINGIKEVTDQYAPGKPVWITEFGMESEPFGSHTNAETATEVTAFYTGLDQIQQGSFTGAVNQPWPELKALFWYDLVDDPNGYSWGLLESNETPKPQYNSYAAVIQTLGPCDGSGGGAGGGGGSSSGLGGSGGSTTSSGTGGTASSSGTGGSTSGSSSGTGAEGSDSEDSSCGCETPGARGGRLGLIGSVGWLALLALRRRRR